MGNFGKNINFFFFIVFMINNIVKTGNYTVNIAFLLLLLKFMHFEHLLKKKKKIHS